MKIVIDARFWGPSHTGLGIYTRELVVNLAAVDHKNDYFLLLRREAMSLSVLPANFKKIEVEAKAYTLWEQVLVSVKLYQLRPDLVHFASINIPVFYFGKFVVTIHDLIKHQSKGTNTSTHSPLVYWPKYLIYRLVSWWAVTFAAKIIVPSNDVRNRILEEYKISSAKIIVTYEAAVLTSGIGQKVSLPNKFVFYVGNAYPHKNLSRLMTAMNEINFKSGAKLVIASGRSVFLQRLTKIADDKVVLLGHLNDKQLTYVHQRALAYVFPSLAEGFGMPALDAMRLGEPVVCSDIPVLHEIYGSAALYFDPTNSADIAAKIVMAIENKKLRAKLIDLGKKQVAKYSWQQTAQETLSVYESCFSL